MKKTAKKKTVTLAKKSLRKAAAKSISRVGKKGDALLIKRTVDNSDFWIKVVDLATRKRKRRMKKNVAKKTRGSGIVPAAHHKPGKSSGRSTGGNDLIFHGAGDAPASTTVSDNGGPKITNVNVHLFMWGSAWLQPSNNPSAGTVFNAVDAILQGPYMNALNQYGVGSGQVVDAFIITSPDPNNPFSEGDVRDMVWDLIDDGHFPEPDDAGGRNEFFAFIMPPGVNTNQPNLNGNHSRAWDYDFPLDIDAAWYCWVMNNGDINSVTAIFSHELVEACTDPEGDGVQVNPRNSSSWNEIGDACASTGVVNGVTVQSYWSQRDQACIIPTIPTTPVAPEVRRRITVNAKFHIVDPGVFSDDTGDFTIARTLDVDSNNPTGQIVITSPVVGGESSADLILNVTWNSDLSVSVMFTSTLFDGSDPDTSGSNNFNLARDTWQSWWVNHQSGDWLEADSCRIDFDIHNDQRP